MKKIIFTFIVSCLMSVVAAEAQLSNSRHNKEVKKRQAIIQKKTIKDPHWKFSDYKPEKNKREERKLQKEMEEQRASSYRPSMSPYYNKKESREEKVKARRKSRMKDERVEKKEKRVKSVRKDFDKKYNKKQKIRHRKVQENKRHFGTRKSRNEKKTTARLTFKDSRN